MSHDLTPPMDPALEALLGGLRERFVASIGARVESVDLLALELGKTAEHAAVLTRIEREAHTLKGSAGTFGFPQVGEAAAEVERVARACRDGAAAVHNLTAAVDVFVQAFRQSTLESAS